MTGPKSSGRVFRANFVLWAFALGLIVFILAAQHVPAHWLLGGVVVALLITRQRHRSDGSTDPSAVEGPFDDEITLDPASRVVVPVLDDTGVEVHLCRGAETAEVEYRQLNNAHGRNITIDVELLQVGDQLVVGEYAERYRQGLDSEFDSVLDVENSWDVVETADGRLTVVRSSGAS